MHLNNLNAICLNNYVLIDVCSVELWSRAWGKSTGFKADSFRETHLWEHFGRTDKIALITCLKNWNVSGTSLKIGKECRRFLGMSFGWNFFRGPEAGETRPKNLWKKIARGICRQFSQNSPDQIKKFTPNPLCITSGSTYRAILVEEPMFGEGDAKKHFSVKEGFFFQWKKGGGIQWTRGLVRMFTGKAIRWRGLGHSANGRTLKTEKLLSSSPSWTFRKKKKPLGEQPKMYACKNVC